MKKSLLATVAAVALIAGTGMVSAAEGAKDHPAAKAGGQIEMNKAPDVKAGADVKGKAQTTGSGAEMKTDTKAGADIKAKPEMKAGADVKAKSDAKPEMKADSKSKTTTKSSTTGAGTADTKADVKSKSSTTGANETKSGADTKAAADTKSNAGASASLTTEQKTKIRTTVIESKSAPKVSRSSIKFDIRVGTVVPRTVHYVAVPSTLVEIHPAWRGHMYFVVDNELIIVDSRGHIVAIVEV